VALGLDFAASHSELREELAAAVAELPAEPEEQVVVSPEVYLGSASLVPEGGSHLALPD
jgi:hypothetical protein